MSDMIQYSVIIFEDLAAFLMTPPISYLVGLFVAVIIGGIFGSLLRR